MKGRMTRLGMIGVVTILLCLIFPQRAYAYLDPGTGSYVIQMLLAALLGIGLILRVYWAKIKSFAGKLFRGTQNAEDGRGESEE